MTNTLCVGGGGEECESSECACGRGGGGMCVFVRTMVGVTHMPIISPV